MIETAGDIVELRLVGVSEDGRSLLLTDDSGTQHTMPIDDRLRAAVHGHLSRLGQLTMALESRISPREIQDRVRGGESAEHVAVTAGVPLERVLRFVGPVLREREHVVEQAQRARLAAGAGGPSSLLSDVVARVAARLGGDPDEVEWDSARRDDHSWVVTVTLPDGTTASWGLDPAHHQASPVDTAARRISGLGDDAPIVLHRSVDLDAAVLGSFDADPAGGYGDDADIGKPGSDDSEDPDTHATIRLFVPRSVPMPDDEVPADVAPTASVDQPELDADVDADLDGDLDADPEADADA
ncbi:MAG: septation protein SepH, partial [Acidothermaceae bacterium]